MFKWYDILIFGGFLNVCWNVWMFYEMGICVIYNVYKIGFFIFVIEIGMMWKFKLNENNC